MNSRAIPCARVSMLALTFVLVAPPRGACLVRQGVNNIVVRSRIARLYGSFCHLLLFYQIALEKGVLQKLPLRGTLMRMEEEKLSSNVNQKENGSRSYTIVLGPRSYRLI